MLNNEHGSKTNSKVKVIKRYQNRKLYDTQQSCYVTLDDIAKMIRANEEVVVIDNKSKNDITAATLTQIIFESEKKASHYAPLFILREIIQYGNGSISGYLAKLGAFPADYIEKQAQLQAQVALEKAQNESMKETLEQRVVTAATSRNQDLNNKSAQDKSAILPAGHQNVAKDNEPPILPVAAANLMSKN